MENDCCSAIIATPRLLCFLNCAIQDPPFKGTLRQTQLPYTNLQYPEVFDPAVIRVTIPAVGGEADRDRGGLQRVSIPNKPGENSLACRPC